MEIAVGHGIALDLLQNGKRMVTGSLELDERGIVADAFTRR